MGRVALSNKDLTLPQNIVQIEVLIKLFGSERDGKKRGEVAKITLRGILIIGLCILLNTIYSIVYIVTALDIFCVCEPPEDGRQTGPKHVV
jgi:hypothetical protein